MTDAVTMATLINTISNFVTFCGLSDALNIKLGLYMGLLSGVSSIIGVFIVNAYGANLWFKRSIGILFFIVLLLQLLKKPDKMKDFNDITCSHLGVLGFVCVLSGILQGMAGVGGPPFIVLFVF
eukprot:UN29172